MLNVEEYQRMTDGRLSVLTTQVVRPSCVSSCSTKQSVRQPTSHTVFQKTGKRDRPRLLLTRGALHEIDDTDKQSQRYRSCDSGSSRVWALCLSIIPYAVPQSQEITCLSCLFETN